MMVVDMVKGMAVLGSDGGGLMDMKVIVVVVLNMGVVVVMVVDMVKGMVILRL